MKKINQITNNLYHIESQPGDATLYDYFVYQYGDDFKFMPCKSSFRFPQKLNFWADVKNNYKKKSINFFSERIIEISKKENVNPYTVAECIRTAYMLYYVKVECKHNMK